MKLSTLLFSLPLLLILAGCSSYPMGMDEETWKRLPPERRAELARQQEAMDHQRRLEALRVEEQEARLRAENERLRLEALRTLYSRLGEGEVIRIGLLGGAGRFYEYRPIVPDSLLLSIGEARAHKVQGRNGLELMLWVRYEPGKVALCSDEPRPEIDPDSCAILVERDWHRGEEYQVDVPDRWRRKKPLLRQLRVHIRNLHPRPPH